MKYPEFMKNIFIITLSAMITAGCSERVDIDLNEEGQKRLVVYGFITTDTMAHSLQLTYTADYFFNARPEPVPGAKAKITDDLGNTEPLTLTDPQKGIYHTSGDFFAVEERTYTLSIELEGERYTAESSCPAFSRTPMHIDLKYQPDWGKEGFYEIRCYYQDPPTTEFYMFNIYKNGTLLTDSLSEKIITDDVLYNGNYTNGIGVGYLDQSKEKEKLHPGDVITFQAGNIPEKYAQFIWEAQAEIQFSTPLFSGPPANVKGNITNGSIGYFAAYPTAYASTTYTP